MLRGRGGLFRRLVRPHHVGQQTPGDALPRRVSSGLSWEPITNGVPIRPPAHPRTTLIKVDVSLTRNGMTNRGGAASSFSRGLCASGGSGMPADHAKILDVLLDER